MRSKPSSTARFVTIGRAMAHLGLSHIPGFSDPTARVFLSDKGKRSLAKIENAVQSGKKSSRVEAARVMADLIGLRTAAIDAAVRAAIANGTQQLVILGAGYDGRAWRMPELAAVKVFEVDHPATQGDKRALVSQLPASNVAVTFVAINFERDSLDNVLTRAGHDTALKTCWIWEGVVMYLTHEAMKATLESVASRSAPGSTLIVNYHTERKGFFAQLIFRLLGEPQISTWTPQEMAKDLAGAGFVVTEDSGMMDWNARYANGEAKIERAKYMRIVVATL